MPVDFPGAVKTPVGLRLGVRPSTRKIVAVSLPDTVIPGDFLGRLRFAVHVRRPAWIQGWAEPKWSSSRLAPWKGPVLLSPILQPERDPPKWRQFRSELATPIGRRDTHSEGPSRQQEQSQEEK